MGNLSLCDADLIGICAGVAYFKKHFAQHSVNKNVVCFVESSTITQGIALEAMNFAQNHQLSNFLLVVFQSSTDDANTDADKAAVDVLKGFGCSTIIWDEAKSSSETAISDIEKFLSGNDKSAKAIVLSSSSLKDSLVSNTTCIKRIFETEAPAELQNKTPCSTYTTDNAPMQKIAPRKAYGTALCNLYDSSDRKVIVLDADVKNSTFSCLFASKNPSNFIECYISEQIMVAAALGIDLAACGQYTVFCSTFAAFFNRAAQQIKLAAMLGSNLNLCGSHVGVSIGQDGPSQMGIEDIALLDSINDINGQVHVFYPSDGPSCERAVYLSAVTQGICYIRTSRPELQVLYSDASKLVIFFLMQHFFGKISFSFETLRSIGLMSLNRLGANFLMKAQPGLYVP